MRPRGCLRPSPPSTECRGGLCACAAWRLRRGRYYLSNAADAGFARRPPPLGRYMTGAARFPSGMRPDASGGRLGRPASAGQPSTGARGVVPLPPCICSGDAAHLLMSFLSGGVARDGCFICLVFGLLVSLQATSWRISRKPETHSLPAAFAITHVRRGALHQLLRLVVQFRLPSALCPSVLPAAKSTDHRSANSKQKCPTF